MSTLARLHDFAAHLRATVERMPESLHRTRDSSGNFALVEQVWHLADLEEEGYSVRITRILSESNPALPDFRGDVVARERRYLEQPLTPALERFEATRAANVARLSALSGEEWRRTGT